MIFAAFFWACSESHPDSAGATSETTNGIAITVVDADRMPVPRARVTLYAKGTLAVLGSAEADTAGIAQFALRANTLANDAFVEAIAGEDSSLMAWTPFDTTQSEIPLYASASLTVRTGAAEADYAALFDSLALDSTPYTASRSGGEYTFAHVPAGMFNIVAGDSLFATVTLDTGATADTLIHIPDVTREFIFEDFNDGDSLNNLAKIYPNSGWNYTPVGNAKFIVPDSTTGFTGALEEDNRLGGKFLSLKFDISDTGFVMISTHLGLDTGYYDMSRLTAIRMKVRSDCNFYVTLEHYKEVENNVYSRALWKGFADENWHEIVFRPGEETLRDDSYQVHFSDIATEIAFFSVYTKSGTFLQIDDIVFEGVDKIQKKILKNLAKIPYFMRGVDTFVHSKRIYTIQPILYKRIFKSSHINGVT